MDASRLLIWVLLSLAGGAFAFGVYLRREIPVPGRTLLALLRAGSLSAILLLLVNPSLPGGRVAAPAWILTDVSPSMSVVQGGRGEEAASPAARLSGAEAGEAGRRTADFGAGGLSLLAPALSRALEAGAGGVSVRTDLRLEDAVAVEALVRGARVPVTFRDVGGPVVNAGVAGLEVEEPRAPGGPVRAELTVATEGVDSLRIMARVAGAPVLDTAVAVQGDGTLRIPLALQPPDTAGPVPVQVVLAAAGDAWPADDGRTRIVSLEDRSGEVVLVSGAPDWEPRFLLPVLADVTGLRVQGFLRLGGEAWLTMRGPPEREDAPGVARALADARLVVVHGPLETLPPSVREAVDGAPAVLFLTAASEGGGRAGEWYLSGELPDSPLAGELAGALAPGLPPLLAARGQVEGPGRSVLDVQRAGAGVTVPALVLEEAGNTRRARGLARGFWRWSFRGGEGRALYRRLWSGVARWLLAAPAALEGTVGLGPVETVVAPGADMAWRAAPARGDSVTVTLVPMEDSPWAETGDAPGAGDVPPARSRRTVPVDSLGRARVPAPGGPGLYGWESRVAGDDRTERVARGILVVEAAAGDLLPGRAVSLLDVEPESDPADAGPGGRPLRTHPVPYLLLVVLLSLEWVGRRRSGLR